MIATTKPRAISTLAPADIPSSSGCPIQNDARATTGTESPMEATALPSARLPRHALFGVRDDRVGCHDGPASARPYPWKTRSGGSGLRRGDPRLPGCRDARFLFVCGARPEPAGLPAGRGLHRQPAVRAARPDAAMVRALSIDAR